MKITHLRITCTKEANHEIDVWAECASLEDVDDLVAWLSLARAMMVGWRQHQETHRRRPTTLREVEPPARKPAVAENANGV